MWCANCSMLATYARWVNGDSWRSSRGRFGAHDGPDTRDYVNRRALMLPIDLGAMFAAFALLALGLSALGLYAVTAYSVAQRTKEIGLRVALGAQPRQVMWTILRLVVGPLAVGLLVGGAGALAVGRRLESVLVQTRPTNPTTLISIAVMLLVVVGLACTLPVKRALGLDPAAALRVD